MPEASRSSRKYRKTLENHYRDMQDMEFTIEHGKLYMLQTRNGKRTAAAAIKIACDLIDEGMITEKEALMQIDAEVAGHAAASRRSTPRRSRAPTRTTSWARVSPLPRAPLRHYRIYRRGRRRRGQEGQEGHSRPSRNLPEDIEGMKYAQGILTVRGGQTSHAAVVARGMGTCCVSGCGDIKMHEEEKYFELGRQSLPRGRRALSGRLHRQYLRHAHQDRSRRPQLRLFRTYHGACRQV